MWWAVVGGVALILLGVALILLVGWLLASPERGRSGGEGDEGE